MNICELQYRSPGRPWWIGARLMALPDPADYVRKVNAPGVSIWEVRAIDTDTGQIWGTACPICDDAHPGPDGSCLL